MSALHEYLKIKYMAPDCKCGDCQLVPTAVIATHAVLIDSAKASFELLRKKMRGDVTGDELAAFALVDRAISALSSGVAA